MSRNYSYPQGSLQVQEPFLDEEDQKSAAERTATHFAQLREELQKEYDEKRSKLPPNVEKLTGGYDMACSWYEIFECFRCRAIRRLTLCGPFAHSPRLARRLILHVALHAALHIANGVADPTRHLAARRARLHRGSGRRAQSARGISWRSGA